MFKRALPWLLLLSGWIALAAYVCCLYLCMPEESDSKTALKNTATAVIPASSTSAWNYSDGSSFSKSYDSYFTFEESKYDFVEPLEGSFNQSMKETASYLVSHPDRQLTVTGYYRDIEENTSILPNLGLARANNVKAYLETLGVSPGQIATKGSLIESMWFKAGVLTKGIDFAFSEKRTSDARIPAIKDRLLGKPLTLYFQTNQNTLSLTQQQRSDFADMFYYLDNVSESSLAVSGHTDNVGTNAYNVKLSEDRATFVKNYLVSKGGVNGERLRVSGLGPNKPISSNDTQEGRAKNRRVEITLE